MVKLLDALKKLGRLNSSSDTAKKTKLTPSEVELMHYKRQEYLDGVKKELAGYRKKNSMLNDNQGMHRSILGKDKKASLFPKSKNSRIGARNILSARGGLW